MDDLDAFVDYQEAPPPSSPSKLLDVPAEMILQLATGMEEPELVAARYGFEPMDFQALLSWKPFQDQVAQKRSELQAAGVTFRVQMAYMAEDLGKDVYRIAKGNEITLPQKLETFRTLAKLADLEPKATTVTGPSGPAFSISINLDSRNKPVTTIEATPEPISLPTFVSEPQTDGNPAIQPA
jgi:hypothetical protein